MNEPATKTDLSMGLDSLGTQLRRELASKADLSMGLDSLRTQLRRELASKTDLSSGLNSFGTQLRRELASKEDLKKEVGALRNDFMGEIGKRFRALSLDNDKRDARIERIEQNMATKQDLNRLYDAVMKSAEQGKAYYEKALSHKDILQDHEAKLKSHEARLDDLESRRPH